MQPSVKATQALIGLTYAEACAFEDTFDLVRRPSRPSARRIDGLNASFCPFVCAGMGRIKTRHRRPPLRDPHLSNAREPLPTINRLGNGMFEVVQLLSQACD